MDPLPADRWIDEGAMDEGAIDDGATDDGAIDEYRLMSSSKSE